MQTFLQNFSMKRIAFYASILVALTSSAQKAAYMPVTLPPHRTCGTMEADSILRANDPSMGTHAQFEQALQQVIAELQTRRSMMPGPYDIPMIVHVIHNGTAVGSGLNLSQAQIYSQFDVLNEDYNNTNADGAQVPAAFQPLRGSLQMNFKKALRDPAGNTLAEPGINRINRNTKGWTAPPYTQTYVDQTIKPNSIWDPTKYFNVWVTDISGGLLGWAQFPPPSTPPVAGLPTNPGSANTDGVVILYSAFGRVGNVAAPYNKGRTLTHEAGHFFGLRHIWGDEAQCAADDYVSDTPQQKGENYGCPSYPQTTQAGGRCSTADPSSMFMNYMDYTDDACMFMFSQGQATRMEAVITSSPRRVELTTSTTDDPLIALDASISNIIRPSGSSCAGTFSPQVTLTNLGSSTLTSVTITYNINGTGSTVYNWTGSLAAGASTVVTLPSATAASGTHTFTVATSSPNNGVDGNTANDSKSQSFTIIAAPATVSLPLVEGFTGTTFPPSGWTLVNPEANNTWTRVTNAGGFGNSTNSAKMDNYSGQVNIAGQTDDLLTPVLNLSNANSTLKLTFNVAYARYNTSYSDSLFVEVTTDCGSTWTRVYGKGGNYLATAPNTTTAFTPTATQWRKDSVMLSAFAGQSNAQFRFRSYSGYGNNVYLDDINLNFTPSSNPPVANFTASATTVCAGSSITFTDQSTNSPTTWSWSFPGGTPSTSTSQNPTVVYNTAGTYAVTLTAANAAGSDGETKTAYITVNASPSVAAVSTPSSICVGSSSTLTATGASTYSWSPAGTLSGTTGNSVTATPTSTTTYTVTGTSSGCTKTATIAVTVNPLPTVSVTPSSTNICTGGTATLTVSGATSATWSPSAGLSSTSGLTVTASPTATTTYTVTGTNANGCSNTATAVVSVTGALTVSISPSTVAICSGASTQLTASGATTYNWSPSTGLSGTTTATVNASPTSTITYTVTGTSGSCTATATRVVTVNPNPTITATGSTAICSGSSATLNATGAGTSGTYNWTPTATLSPSTGNQVSATPTSTTTYTVTGTNSNGCKSTSTAVITVNQLPNVVASGGTSICNGSSATLTATGAATYNWSPAVTLNSATGQTVVATPASTTTYTVTGTSSSGCSKTATVAVTVKPVPSVQATASSTSVCAGSSTVITSSGATTYSWSPGASLNTTTGATVTATPASTTTYTVSGTTNGCTSSSTVVISVNSVPAITMTGSSSICSGGSTQLVASGAGTNGSYYWSPSASLSSSSGNSVTASPASTTTYTVTGTSSAGCYSTSTGVVTVTQNPSITAGPSTTICSGTSAQLSATGASTYSWSPAASLSSSSGTSVLATPSVTTTYTITGTAAGGCTGTTSVVVNVVPAVTSSAMATPDSTSVGTAISFMNMSANGTSYQWSFGDGNTSSASDPTHTYGAAGIYTVTLTADNGVCSATSTIIVEITAPNGIQKNAAAVVRIYPNPSADIFTFDFGTQKPDNMIITDAIGNIVLQTSSAETASVMNVDLSHLAKGVYFARIMSGETNSVIRMVLK